MYLEKGSQAKMKFFVQTLTTAASQHLVALSKIDL